MAVVTTWSKAQWEEAEAAWADFSAEWEPYRAAARQRGMLYPPSGTRWDSWEDPQPSQRAIVVRAIRDTPQLLTAVIASSRSWREVVRTLMVRLAELREQADADEDGAERRRAEDRSTRSHAPELLAQLVANAQAHRTAQLEAIAGKARAVVDRANELDWADADEVLTEALTDLEGLLLAIGDGS